MAADCVATAEMRVGEQTLERGPQGRDVVRRDDESSLPVDDEVAEATHPGRHHRPRVGHRLETGDAEAFSAGRAGDDRCAPVQPLELVMRDEAERTRHARADRPVARDDELHPASRLHELEHARTHARAEIEDVDSALSDQHFARQ